jgi:hypothetical protein
MKRLLYGFLILLITLLISAAYIAVLVYIYQQYQITGNEAWLMIYVVNVMAVAWMLGKSE